VELLFCKSKENGTIEMFADMDWDTLKARLFTDRVMHGIEEVLLDFDHYNVWDALANKCIVDDGSFVWWRWSEPKDREFAPVKKDDTGFGVDIFEGRYLLLEECRGYDHG